MKKFNLKTLTSALILGTALIGGNALADVNPTPMKGVQTLQLEQNWDKVFPQSDKVEHHKVTFKNRFGITLAGDLYVPKNVRPGQKLAAIAVSGPFGAVKEQVSGRYAQTLAERGFVTLAFDPSYTGESGGEPRGMASPDVNTEDFSAAIDFLGLQNFVDRDRLGILGVCGFGGQALNAAAMDTRVKAVASSVLYDMSRSIGWGVGDQQDGYTPAQRQAAKEFANNLRWADAESGYHPRGINSNTAWLATMPLSYMNIPMMSYINEISPRPILIVVGENAHSRYMSEDAFKNAGNNPNKELLIVEGATHVDLYDDVAGKIPYDKFEQFFKANLK